MGTSVAGKPSCLTDHYQLACDGMTTRTVTIAGGEPYPDPPPGWMLLAASEVSAWTDARRRYAECPKCSEDLLEALIRSHPDAAPFFRLRGVARAGQERIADAAADLERAVALAPENRLYRLEQAELRLRLGRDAEAIEDLVLLDRSAEPTWDYFREWISITARTLQRTGDLRAPQFVRRACRAGIKDLCAKAPAP